MKKKGTVPPELGPASVAMQIITSSRVRKTLRSRLRDILNLLAERGTLSVMEYAAQEILEPSYVRRIFHLVALRHADVEFKAGLLRLVRKEEKR